MCCLVCELVIVSGRNAPLISHCPACKLDKLYLYVAPVCGNLPCVLCALCPSLSSVCLFRSYTVYSSPARRIMRYRWPDGPNLTNPMKARVNESHCVKTKAMCNAFIHIHVWNLMFKSPISPGILMSLHVLFNLRSSLALHVCLPETFTLEATQFY